MVLLEQHAGNRVARLRIVTHTVWTDYRDLEAMLNLFDQALARRRPLMIIWDVRSLTFPRVRAEQVKQVRAFLKTSVEAFDTYVQAHVIILSNALIRGFARLMLGFFEPPQPYLVTGDDESANQFAESCCNKPRSYRKASYAVGAEFGLRLL